MSSFVLKIIACLTMLIDHTAIVFSDHLPYGLYMVLRGVGRSAFVIFCFLIAEGFIHTRSRGRYALRLGLFALLCEIPFDLLFYGQVLSFSHQNVYLTLLLGLLGLWGYTALREKGMPVIGLLCPAVCALMAELLRADYGAGGVWLIAVLYLLREHKLWQGAAVLVLLFWMGDWLQAFGIVGWLLCLTYNGRRGPNIKYAFYAFYPLHMLGLLFSRYIL